MHRPRPIQNPKLHHRIEPHPLRPRRVQDNPRPIQRVPPALFILRLPHRPHTIDLSVMEEESRVLRGGE